MNEGLRSGSERIKKSMEPNPRTGFANTNYQQPVTTPSLVGALLRQENIFASGYNSVNNFNFINQFQGQQAQDFKWYEHIPSDLTEYADRFSDLNNETQIAIRAQQIRRELVDKQRIGQSPLASLALSLPLALLDPTSYMPLGEFYKTYRATRLATQGLISGAISGVAGATIQEALLTPTQLTRDIDENISNIVFSGLLSAVFGGAAGHLANRKVNNFIKKSITNTLDDGNGPPRQAPLSPENIAVDGMDFDKSLSAAQVRPGVLEAFEQATFKGEELVGPAKYLNKILGWMSPMNSMFNSTFKTVRTVVDFIFDHNITKFKNTREGGFEARPTSLEAEIKQDFGNFTNVNRQVIDIFNEQAGIKSGALQQARSDFFGKGLSRDEFGREVGRALLSGDVHNNPYVERAAKLFRDKVFNPLRDRAIKLGLLEPGVTNPTAMSYLMRIYNKQFIKENPKVFADKVRPWFIETNEQLKALMPFINRTNKKIKKTEKQIKKAKGKRKEELQALLKSLKDELREKVPRELKHSDGSIRSVLTSADEIEAAIQMTKDNILGRGDKQIFNPILSRLTPNKTRPLKTKEWMIPDLILADSGIMKLDAFEIANSYVKAMAPTIRLTEFARGLDPKPKRKSKADQLQKEVFALEKRKNTADPAEIKNIEKQIEALEERIEDLGNEASISDIIPTLQEELRNELNEMLGTDPKKNAKLETDFDKQINNLTTSFEMLQGIYGNGYNTTTDQQFLRNLKNWNFSRYLGYILPSAFGDVGFNVMNNGITPYIQSGLLPVIKRRILDDPAVRNNLDVIRDLGFAINQAKSGVMRNMIEQADLTVKPGIFSRGLEKTSVAFGDLSLSNQWQDLGQELAGNVSISRTLRAIDQITMGKAISDAERSRLARLGIDKDSFKVIHQQYKKYGGKSDGSYYSGLLDWDIESPDVARAYNQFRNAIFQDIKSTVAEPGYGDLPTNLFGAIDAYSPVGQILLDLKSWFFGITNRGLLAGLSRNDLNFYTGVMTGMSMGVLSYIFKQITRDPLGKEEIDLSLQTLTLEAIDNSGVLGVLSLPLQAGLKTFGVQTGTRYINQNLSGIFAGPTVGAADELLRVINAVYQSSVDPDRNFTTKDAEKILRLMPFQNLFYLNYLNRQVSNQAAIALGAEEAE